MAYRRKLIDRRTREGRKLGNFVDCAKGLVVIGLLVAWAVSRSGTSSQPTREAAEALVPSVQAASAQPSYMQPSPSPPQVAQPSPQQYAMSDTQVGSMPSDPPAPVIGQPAPRSLMMPDAAATPTVAWRHVTSGGNRWSLRHIGLSSLLLVDLGADEVGRVYVDPAFEALDMPSMNARVDHIRSTISQFFPGQTANYSFGRDGTLRHQE